MIQKQSHQKTASKLRLLAAAAALSLFGIFQHADAQTANVTLNTANATGLHTATQKITLDNGFSADGSVGAFGAVIVPPSLFSCGTLGTPSSAQNYVATYAPRIPINDAATIGSHTTCEVNQTIQYVDGLGRPLQTVQVQANPDGTKDVVQPVAYDVFGRETTKYLPYTTSSGTSGNYRSDALTGTSGYSNSAQYSFYQQTGQNYTTNTSPFALTVIEPSPLNRVLEQGAPGDVWQPAGSRTTTAGRTVVMDYANNAASEVLLWTVNSTGATAGTNYYAAGTLYKTISKSENWTSGLTGTTEEFKDLEGHVVLKRLWESETSNLSTYYVYDDLENLSYVIPPAVTVNTFTENDAVFANLIYGYHYDERQRLIQKKIPGKGWEYTVYNTLDQVVATQDAKQQANGQWIITKYDALGRAIINGIWNSSMSQADLKTNVYAQTTQWENKDNTQTYGYTLTNTYPTTLNTVLSVNYYDDYDIVNLPSVYDQHTTNSTMTRGLSTATLTNVLGTTDMLWTVNYYDDKGRVTHTYAQHYLGGTANLNTANYDHIQNTYDFTNQVTNTTRTHYTNSSGTPNLAVTIANAYVYDHIGRKRQSFEQINSGTNTLISQNDYNEVGQELTKHLHSTDGGSTFLQDIAYSYNERGWLKSSNAQLFAMQLKYNDGTVPQYNGNIADQNWGTPGSLTKGYTYGYDALNRLAAGTGSTGNTENNIQYDKMGNLTQLNRYYSSTLIDQLTYNYTVSSNATNQLQSVADASTDASTKGYKSGTYTYHYDANGNMDMDNSKGLTISYNLLNLPQTNTLSSGTVSYVYEASGAKLRKISTIGTTTTTDYIGGIQYTNGAIDFIQTEEGRALKSGSNYNYEYNLADHLGNVRLSFDTHTGLTSTTQQTDYMPFGMEVTVGSIVSPKNEYLYNKKELQEELGQYDYGARFYDPVIGRWTSVDPLAEKSRRFSPYTYGDDNSISNIDPDGMETLACPECATLNIAFLKGVGESVVSTVTGTWDAITHPVQTAKAIGSLNTPEGALNLTMAAVSTYGKFSNGSPEVKANMAGNFFGNVGQLFIGTGEVKAATTALRGIKVADEASAVTKIADVVDATGFGPKANPIRVQGPWTEGDLARAAKGQGPVDFIPATNKAGKNMPLELHHGDQMPGSAIHEVPPAHSGSVPHPNKYNQGVTPQMRTQDSQLHWYFRGLEMGGK